MPELNDHQTLRYCRHILLPQIDFEGQEKLLGSRVLVIGLGGLGSACLPYLSAAGIGQITLVDFDHVELTNLQRQIIYQETDIDRPKAEAAADFVSKQNSDCNITTILKKLAQPELDELVAEHDIVVDCTDNLATRQTINQACYLHKVPLVSGAAIRFEGQITTFTYTDNTPCYHCFSHSFGEQNLSCVESGVAAPLVGMVGSAQAMEVIKILTRIGKPYVGRLLMMDGLYGEQRIFQYAKRHDCQVCGHAG